MKIDSFTEIVQQGISATDWHKSKTPIDSNIPTSFAVHQLIEI
jgi:hypothetical protein